MFKFLYTEVNRIYEVLYEMIRPGRFKGVNEEYREKTNVVCEKLIEFFKKGNLGSFKYSDFSDFLPTVENHDTSEYF